MAEVLVKDGSWMFDGRTLRIVPARERSVHKLRQALGELAVPLEAIAGISYEPARKGGRLRLRLREGVDPFTQAAGGRIPDAADPYRLSIDASRTGAAQYFTDEVRNALVIEQVPGGPSDRYLMQGPGVPLTASGGDGTATFDGETIRLEWNWMADEEKRSLGAQQIALRDLLGVEWTPSASLENGNVRFRVRGAVSKVEPKHDPYCLQLWGFDKEVRTVSILLAAIVARLPHPAEPQVVEEAPPPLEPEPGESDVLVRRLRELGELHRDGVLTEEEFAQAKQSLLRRL